MQQQQVVLAGLDRAKHDECWAAVRIVSKAFARTQVGAKQRHDAGGCGHAPLAGEVCQAVESRPTIADYSGRALQHRVHTLPVTLPLPRPAELGMGNRNKVMNEINGANVRALRPPQEVGVLQPGMADVEVRAPSSRNRMWRRHS